MQHGRMNKIGVQDDINALKACHKYCAHVLIGVQDDINALKACHKYCAKVLIGVQDDINALKACHKRDLEARAQSLAYATVSSFCC
jgi:hypothetical protein